MESDNGHNGDHADASGNGSGGTRSGGHLVHFYDSDDLLTETVAAFCAGGLAAGEPLVLVATPTHRDSVAAHLARGGTDLDAACRAGDAVFHDARQALASFMDGDVPHEGRFRSTFDEVLRRGSARKPNARLRVFGEMVDLLCGDGKPEAALAVERLWSDLARSHAFSLLCAYSTGNLFREVNGTLRTRICDAHDGLYPHPS